ncbi:MAG: hypothetical protein ACFN00_00600 [Flavobacteriaceae bacterium]|jgi:hypothetical protein
MKKIDIEKWERKMPELPENFFEEMQEKVLDKTVRAEKQPVKRFKINPVWASVAAIAVFFGISFFVNFKNKNVEVTQNPQMVQTENHSNLNQQQTTESRIDVAGQEVTENQSYTESKTSFAGQSSDVVSEQKVKNLSTKLKMEEVLNVMSEEELQELATNYEQDAFLDLY